MKSLLSQNFYQTMSDLLQTLISHSEQVFSGCTVLLDSKETEIESKDLEASRSAGKNTERVLMPCQKWKSVPTAISNGVDISKVPRCHLLQQMSSQ